MDMAFGHDTTTDEVLEGIDLTGKSALVTGASGGLGAETARALASKGATVTLAVRDVAKGEAVAQGIRESTGASIDVVELDLASLDRVRACAECWLADPYRAWLGIAVCHQPPGTFSAHSTAAAGAQGWRAIAYR
jgi:NAD(P)-dependent dehydrogenase (short-subunit alcohol dehydrogenase family)